MDKTKNITQENSEQKESRYRYVYRLRVFGGMIRLYTSLLMPLGFPPPRPIIVNCKKQITFRQLKYITDSIFPIPNKIRVKVHDFLIKTPCKIAIYLSPISLVKLGFLVGLDSDHVQALEIHHRRFYPLRISSDISFLLLYIPILTLSSIAIFVFILHYFFLIDINEITFLEKILYFLSLPVVYIVPTLFLLRVLFTVTQRLIAETICVQEILYILLDLKDNSVLTYPERRFILMKRIQYLSKITKLIPKKYFLRHETDKQIWIDNHFNYISKFIDERERWIIAPNQNTLNDLRQDFMSLSRIYITGLYGNFDWDSVELSSETHPSKPTWFKELLKVLIRIVGIVIPLIALGLYIFLPENLHTVIFSGISISKDNVTYIFLAWLLITIDISLQLGFVNTLIEIAKGLKDIGK